MDRIRELKANCPKSVVNLEGNDKENESTIQIQRKEINANNQFSEFFNNIEAVKQNISIIKNASRRITEVSQLVLQANIAEKESAQSKGLETLINSTNKTAADTKRILHTMQSEAKAMITNKKTAVSAEVRLRENMCNTLIRKFIEVMREYQDTQSTFKIALKKKVKRQVEILKPGATPEEIDAVYKAGGTTTLFKQAILTNEPAEAIQNAFLKAEEKYKDVLVLEASLAELQQMFIDFAMLVEQQGELLDQIEHHVQIADEHFTVGNGHLKKAIRHQKDIRKRQCGIASLAFILVGGAVGVIAGKVGGVL